MLWVRTLLHRDTVGNDVEYNKVSSDAVPEVVRELANGLATIYRQVEPILRELTVGLEPLMRSLKTAAPLV